MASTLCRVKIDISIPPPDPRKSHKKPTTSWEIRPSSLPLTWRYSYSRSTVHTCTPRSRGLSLAICGSVVFGPLRKLVATSRCNMKCKKITPKTPSIPLNAVLNGRELSSRDSIFALDWERAHRGYRSGRSCFLFWNAWRVTDPCIARYSFLLAVSAPYAR